MISSFFGEMMLLIGTGPTVIVIMLLSYLFTAMMFRLID